MLKQNEVTRAVEEKNAEPLNGNGFYRFRMGDFVERPAGTSAKRSFAFRDARSFS
jgi:hypothetical protein